MYPQAEVDFSAARARRLIAASFPRLADARIEPLGQGWDNWVYLVAGEFVFRFPRRQLGADCLEAELRVLPNLTGLPLPISVPT